jgi:hypothetical protein
MTRTIHAGCAGKKNGGLSNVTKTQKEFPMNDPVHPVPGDMSIDASDVNAVDLTPDQVPQLIKFHDGVAKALANIMRLTPEQMQRAGMFESQVQRARELIAEYQRCEELLPAADKLAELLYETKLDRADQISVIMGELVAQARRRAAREPKPYEILGPLADLLEYQLGPANKAVATKAKAKENAAPVEAPPVEAPPAEV